VGFAAGDIPKVPLNLALLKGCAIVGVFWGAFTRNQPQDNRRNNEELLQMYLEGKIKPHIHATYPLERAAEALNEVMNKRVSGKVVLTTE
jgi:NADPH2:quinone reductase